MVKIIAGLKGSGKTKTLIDMVNASVKSSKGSVVCLEDSDKLRFDISYDARLVDVSTYGIYGARELYGFVAGMVASNHDITDVYIDAALRMCRNDAERFDFFFTEAAKLAEANEFNLVVTASIEADNLPENLKKYL